MLRDNQLKSSLSPIQPEVKAYLEDLLEDGFNAYCIDCKNNETTHCLVSYGTFVCKQCVIQHRRLFGNKTPGSINVYAKPIFTSHWDDYQLKSICRGFGGNEPMFNFLKEFDLDEETSLFKRYDTRALRWYKAHHMSFMEGIAYAEAKPIKDFTEGWNKTKALLKDFSTDVEAKTSNTIKNVEEANIGDKLKGFWSRVTGKNKNEEAKQEEPEPLALLADDDEIEVPKPEGGTTDKLYIA